MEGYLAEAGFTLDDLAGLAFRLNTLTPEQQEAMIIAYREKETW
jgi:autonomous glycyl radical cofactor GrcA